MKKILSMLLVGVMCISLCACGGNDTETTMSKEKLLEEAISVDIITLQNAVYENQINAKDTYCDIPIKVTGNVLKIEEDHVVICDSQVCLDAYLSRDDLRLISSGNTISVVGIITELTEEKEMVGGTEFSFKHFIMSEGYLTE